MNLLSMAFTTLLVAFTATSNAQSAYPIDGQYKVNPGDVLSIHVWNEEPLSVPEVLVRPDGYFSIPIVGDVMAGGKNITEIESTLTDGLKNYLRDNPVVTVSLAAISGNTIYVLGKVNRPGQFIIRAATDVTQALALAGGVATFADENSIKILRRDQQGRQRALAFNYSRVKDGKNLDSNILLQSGDVVLVP